MPTSPSLFLLDRNVKTAYFNPDLDEVRADVPAGDGHKIQLRVLTSEGKQAFGFDADRSDLAVRDLVLEADLAGLPGCSSLILRGGVRCAGINTVDKDLILIASDHPEDPYGVDVFLIYNAIDRSLRMIPTMPTTTYHSLRTATVLIARKDAKDTSYALVFPGTDADGVGVFFVSPSSSNSPYWTVKKFNLPVISPNGSCYRYQAVFSFRGRGYWVDLLAGGIYCECCDLLSEDITCVDMKLFPLPVGCKQYFDDRSCLPDARAFRAIGPVGDTIKFVTIDGYLEFVDFKNFKLRVWRLMEDLNWDLEYELNLSSLLEGGEFKGVDVPALEDWTALTMMAPMYPILSPQEDHVIYFAVGDLIPGKGVVYPEVVCFMLRVDLCSKTFNCTTVSPSVGSSMGQLVALYSNSEGKLFGLQA